MPDVKWFAGGGATITVGTTVTSGGTANRLLRDDGDSVESSIAQDDGSNITLTAGGLLLSANDQGALGASGTAWADLFLASGGVINFAAGGVTATHVAASDSLDIAAGNLRVATAFLPTTSDGAALGSVDRMWSDGFFASGAVLNFNAGDVTVTHSADTLTIGGGQLTLSASLNGVLTVNQGIYAIQAGSAAYIGFGIVNADDIAIRGGALAGTFSFNTTGMLAYDPAGLIGWPSASAGTTRDTALGRNAAGVVEINSGTPGTRKDLRLSGIYAASAYVSSGAVAIAQASGYVEIMEQSAPTAGEKSSARIFVSSAVGKRNLSVQFGTGSPIVFATEL